MVRCELCGKDVTDRAGIFTVWFRTAPVGKFVRARGIKLGGEPGKAYWVPSRDKRKRRVYCNKCRKRVNRMLTAIRQH
jgi:hypothetical protein